jgi:hypothetical protein
VHFSGVLNRIHLPFSNGHFTRCLYVWRFMSRLPFVAALGMPCIVSSRWSFSMLCLGEAFEEENKLDFFLSGG